MTAYRPHPRERHISMKTAAWLLTALALSPLAHAADPPAARAGWDAATSTGAAVGYCLARHPYLHLAASATGGFTRDGFELVAAPGIVGAVRRNFVFDRATDAQDEGQANTCRQACGEFGKLYGRGGTALRQKVGHGKTSIASGIGDLAALVVQDHDFYARTAVPAGAWSRGNSWHESDVAQADYCCCQVKGIDPHRSSLPIGQGASAPGN